MESLLRSRKVSRSCPKPWTSRCAKATWRSQRVSNILGRKSWGRFEKMRILLLMIFLLMIMNTYINRWIRCKISWDMIFQILITTDQKRSSDGEIMNIFNDDLVMPWIFNRFSWMLNGQAMDILLDEDPRGPSGNGKSPSLIGKSLVGGLEPWTFMTFHILGSMIPTRLWMANYNR